MPQKIQTLEHRQPTTLLTSRICELMDTRIYDWLIFVSGHSLKHITAGIGCLVSLRYLRLRRRLDQ